MASGCNTFNVDPESGSMEMSLEWGSRWVLKLLLICNKEPNALGGQNVNIWCQISVGKRDLSRGKRASGFLNFWGVSSGLNRFRNSPFSPLLRCPLAASSVELEYLRFLDPSSVESMAATTGAGCSELCASAFNCLADESSSWSSSSSVSADMEISESDSSLSTTVGVSIFWGSADPTRMGGVCAG